MPRKKKVKRILFSIAALISIGLGGFAVHQQQEKQKMIEIATSKEARKVYEDYLKKIEESALTSAGKIQEYEIDKSDLDYNPMGGLMVRLYINNDTQMDIQIGIVRNQKGKLEVFGATGSPKLAQLLEEGE
ncbi:DUF1310 family protein [Streptococcus sp. H31]|uniref:DUF1310 family protein n=1 Tax=Streptococcus huangxiaojuni TaxID=3237239 RepID=UPI0034A11A55